MCGRFFIDLDYEALLERYGIGRRMVPFEDYQGEILPSSQIMYTDGKNFNRLPWGHRPSFSKKLLINARSESLHQKPYFKGYEPRIIYASEYYEWHQQTKVKYAFTNDEHLLPLAAIELYHDQASFLVILTKEADENIVSIHERMPVILPFNNQGQWLSGRSIAFDDLMMVSGKAMGDEQLSFI